MCVDLLRYFDMFKQVYLLGFFTQIESTPKENRKLDKSTVAYEQRRERKGSLECICFYLMVNKFGL